MKNSDRKTRDPRKTPAFKLKLRQAKAGLRRDGRVTYPQFLALLQANALPPIAGRAKAGA